VLFTTIVAEIERRAQTHEIGHLQEIRKELKGKIRLPGPTIFHRDTVMDTYAFHYGGRKELQFNVGTEPGDRIRHGVAFSFESSRSLPEPDLLLPSVKRFNDFLRVHPDSYRDMRMWHYDEHEQRSAEYRPIPIEPDLIRRGVFIFMGKTQPLISLDYDLILDDFDRLLPLYEFVEGSGDSSAEQASSSTLYIAGDKPAGPNTFFHAVQTQARQPITLSDLIERLRAIHKMPEGRSLVPTSTKDHDFVIKVRTTYAATHGYLKPIGDESSATDKGTGRRTKFTFTSGCTLKRLSTTVSLAQRELDIDLRHNAIQRGLHNHLVAQYGQDNVGTELENAAGRVDVVVRRDSGYWFYEIKTASTARGCIREALPQLLEYSYWPGAQVANRLVVVGEPPLDRDSEQYLSTLRDRFGLPAEYEQFDIKSGRIVCHIKSVASVRAEI
jgi:hypothetical protein